jgi:replicative DNA helicase
MVVIAAVVVDEGARKYLQSIRADHFYGRGHAAAWRALQDIERRGLSYDPATVRQISGGRADAEQIEQYVRDRPSAPPNLGHHVEMLLWDRQRVEAARGPVTQFIEAIRDPTADPSRLRSLSRQVAQSFEGVGAARHLCSPRALVEAHSLELTARREGRAVYPTGIEALDNYGEGDVDHRDGVERSLAGRPRLVPNLAPGKVTLMTGVSGSCKTTMAALVALLQAELDRRVLFGAWEQGSGMTMELIAAMSLGWSRTDVMVGDFDEEEQRQLEEEMLRLGEWITFFELPFGRTRGEHEINDRNIDLIQEHVAASGCDLFVADLMRRAFKETSPDDEEQALYRLQAMAQQERVHLAMIHQLRLKDVEQREDKRPTRESIKGSSGWVDVSDQIIGWHRPSLFKNLSEETLQAIVLKQRYGRCPEAVEWRYLPEYGQIDDGHTIEYLRPGEEGAIDGFLAEAKPAGRRGRRER